MSKKRQRDFRGCCPIGMLEDNESNHQSIESLLEEVSLMNGWEMEGHNGFVLTSVGGKSFCARDFRHALTIVKTVLQAGNLARNQAIESALSQRGWNKKSGIAV